MTDSDSTFGEEGSDSPTESKPNWRRDLENRAKEAETQLADAQSKLSGYERRDVFRSAGLDLEDRQVSYFVKAYDGEMDAEVIRAEAEAAGFLGSDAPQTVPGASQSVFCPSGSQSPSPAPQGLFVQ